jgi:hypothetical protein
MSLAANFFSENQTKAKFGRQGANIIFPRQKLFFGFASPPEKAENVHVQVLEDVEFLDGTAPVTGRVLGEMIGKIEGKKFIPETGKFRPPANKRDSLRIEIAYEDHRFGAEMEIPLPEAEDVDTHQLRLNVTGKVGGKIENFTSDVRIHVHYPLAMIVPTAGATRDPALDVCGAWGRQWSVHDLGVRKLVKVPFVRLTRAPVDGDYDSLVSAFGTAAAFADEGAGVIALGVGHGDGGDTNTIPWCNLVPEDFPPPEGGAPFLYRMDIDTNVLNFGLGGVNSPGSTDRVKLRALDRIAAVLKPLRGVRRVILHSCKVGNSQAFMQLMADRLQVAVRSHRASVEYTGAAKAPDIAAQYAGKTIVRPRDERQWPVGQLSSPVVPGKEPRRW